MPFNKTTNPYGVAESGLGWRGFADGARHSNPAALAPPTEDPYTKLALKALVDMGGAAWDEYTAPELTGKMWDDELNRFDTAIAAQKTPETIEAAKKAKRIFASSHPNAGKDIYARPGWTEYVPDFLMKGGSNYEVPEGALNVRQSNYIRNNWKADPNFVPEAGPLSTKKKVVVPVVKPDDTFPNQVTVDPNESIPNIAKAKYINKVEQERDALKQFTKASKDKGVDPFSNNWGEYWMKKDERRVENIRDSLRDWVSPGVAHGSMSEAEAYFSNPKNKGQYAEYKKDPYAWYAKNIEPNKDFSEFSFFGN